MIVTVPEPTLRQPSELWQFDDSDDELNQIIHDMKEEMRRLDGVGFAAPQISVNKQIFIWVEEGTRVERGGRGPKLHTAINPQIYVMGQKISELEGCLSIPNERYPKYRFETVRLKTYDMTGTPYTIVRKGFAARIIQHEYDHLKGKLIDEL